MIAALPVVPLVNTAGASDEKGTKNAFKLGAIYISPS